MADRSDRYLGQDVQRQYVWIDQRLAALPSQANSASARIGACSHEEPNRINRRKPIDFQVKFEAGQYAWNVDR